MSLSGSPILPGETTSIFENGAALLAFMKKHNGNTKSCTKELAEMVVSKATDSQLQCTIKLDMLRVRLNIMKKMYRANPRQRRNIEAAPQQGILLKCHGYQKFAWQPMACSPVDDGAEKENVPPQGMTGDLHHINTASDHVACLHSMLPSRQHFQTNLMESSVTTH